MGQSSFFGALGGRGMGFRGLQGLFFGVGGLGFGLRMRASQNPLADCFLLVTVCFKQSGPRLGGRSICL